MFLECREKEFSSIFYIQSELIWHLIVKLLSKELVNRLIKR